MASRGTRYFYSRVNHANQDHDNREQSSNQQVASKAHQSSRGLGRGRSYRTSFEPRQQEEPVDPRNTWPQLCERHKELRKRFPELPCFKIPSEVYDAVISKNVRSLPLLSDLHGELDPTDYVKPLMQLLEVEEAHQGIEMRKFDMINKRVDLQLSCIDFPGLSNGQPSLVPGDIAIIHDHTFTVSEIFYIVTTRGDKIMLNPRRVAEKEEILKNALHIALVSSGTQFEACRRALAKSSYPFIQNIITEARDDINKDRAETFDLSWTKSEFEKSVGNLSEDSWLKTLLTTARAHEDIKKVFVVNPGLWPVLRGCRYDPDAEPAHSYTIDTREIVQYADAGHVIIQSPISLKTVIIPISELGYNSFQLDADRCNDVREFFHEDSHDLMFVSSSLIEKAKLTEPAQPSVQPSLRDLFHGSREDLDCKLANKTEKMSLSDYSESKELLHERLNKLNGPQRQAVVAIMEARYRPRPYILFGPPGTGKTHTLVEAVVQIYIRDSRSRILFCANSNTCADQIYEKLDRTGLIDMNDLERIKAGDRVAGLSFRRIIVTTNIKSAGFMSQSGAFDFVFLDEAGHAHEPESLIPICSLDDKDGCLVLAGDPKQLGPVVQCQEASDLGLGQSMLERIFKFKSYDRHQPYGRYNKFYITKLLHCYRCDPNILEISNKLFYDDELKYVNEAPRSLLKILRLQKSVQFRHIQGREDKPTWSTSWRNFQEVDICVDIILRLYKMGFDAEQIGVITPYKLQSKEIVKKLKSVISENSRLLNLRFPAKSVKISKKTPADLVEDNLVKNLQSINLSDDDTRSEKVTVDEETDHKIVWSGFKRDWVCKIDTVDAFQGNEREVIIISTVRTGARKNLDFLNDARRFNVAISRAKWLVIVVGDKDIISGGNYWSEFYKRAERNNLNQWPMKRATSETPHSCAVPLFRR